MSNKLGKFELDGWTILGAVVAAYILIPSVRGFFDGLSGGAGQPAPTQTGMSIECIYDGAVMTVGPIQKKYAPTTAITGAGHRVWINGVDRGVKVSSSTLDVTYGNSIAVYYNHNASIAETQKNKYYVAEQKFVVPCVSTLSTGDSNIDPDDKHSVIKMGIPTISFFNDDDGLKNAQENAENISTSDVSNIEMKIVKGAKTGFSPYGKQYICAVYNSTAISDIQLSAVSGVSGTIATETVPTVVSNDPKLGSKAGFSLKCWSSKGTSSLSTVTEKFNLYVETSTKGLPAKNANSVNNAINVSIWDEDWYRNTDTGKMEFGPQDDQYNKVGSAAGNATLWMVG